MCFSRFRLCRFRGLVGSSGLEPPTLRLSGARSNHLSYEPLCTELPVVFPSSRPFCEGPSHCFQCEKISHLRDFPTVSEAKCFADCAGTSKLNNVMVVTLIPKNSLVFALRALARLTSKVLLCRSPCFAGLLRKEVIQPHLPIRLPCYDFTPITDSTFGAALLSVTQTTSGVSGSHGVTGGVYKARERIHRGMLIRDY